MFENLGMGELLIIMFVVLILFGGKKIPEIAKNLGKGINEFKKGLNDLKKEVIRARRRVAELQKSFCIGNRGGESYHIVLTDESGDTLSQEMRRTIRRQTSFEDKIKRRKSWPGSSISPS